MSERKYTIDDTQKKEFASVYLLHHFINEKLVVPVYLEGNSKDLEPVLEFMMMRQYINIDNENNYVPTVKGKDVLKKFMARYTEFLKVFDVYCAVDLDEGSFAFEDYFDFPSESRWEEFLSQERWEDLRIAVTVFKQMDPIEIVFMSFLDEGQFGDRGQGWEFDLLLGSIWDEILHVCETALHPDDLDYEEDGEYVSGDAVMEDVIQQGAELMANIRKKELEMDNQNTQSQQSLDNYDEYGDVEYNGKVTVRDVPISVYEKYYDPKYVSPMWRRSTFKS